MTLRNILFLVFVFIVVLTGCITSHRFRDSKTRILPNTKISKDSIDGFETLVVGFNYPSDKYTVHPIDLMSRQDSIVRYLKYRVEAAFQKQVNLLQKRSDCDYLLYKYIEGTLSENSVTSLRTRSFNVDSFALNRCVSLPMDKDIMVMVFRLETTEVGYGSLSVWDGFNGSYFYVSKGKIKMYRRFRSNQLSQRRFFPKGSEDREAFPHFPQRQIERVVDALVEDLKTRVQ